MISSFCIIPVSYTHLDVYKRQAQSLGLEASGVPANLSHYPGQPLREAREIIARCKDVLNCFVTHQSSQSQTTISLDGDGDQIHNQAI